MKTSPAQKWRATENGFVTTTGIWSHKPAASAAATRRHVREGRAETEQLRGFAVVELVFAGVSGNSPGQEMKGGPGRWKPACAEGWVCGPLSLVETRLAS